MRLKTFTARDMTEAMALVRRDMGPDAVIVAVTTTARGNVEVRAAVDAPPQREPRRDARPDEEPPSRARHDASGTSGEDFLRAALRFHGAPDDIAESIVKLAGARDAEHVAPALARALEARFAFKPLPLAPERPVFLIGPPGSGKTSAAAKLAARATLSGLDVRLVAADVTRAAAPDQVRAYADVLKARFSHAEDAPSLAEIMRAIHPAEVAFIDGPPVNPFDIEELETTAELVRASGAEPVAVLDAAVQPLDLADAAATYTGLGCRRLIIAKCDAARRVGGALAALDAGLALAAISASPFIGGGLTPATSLRLARFFLDGADLETPVEGAPHAY